MFLCWVALQLWWRYNYSEYGSRMQNWKEVNVWSSTVYSCDFHEGRQHFITLLMCVCVEFCFILLLIYSSDFHEGRQYFITLLMLVLNFAF